MNTLILIDLIMGALLASFAVGVRTQERQGFALRDLLFAGRVLAFWPVVVLVLMPIRAWGPSRLAYLAGRVGRWLLGSDAA